jgi:hypothetical protein
LPRKVNDGCLLYFDQDPAWRAHVVERGSTLALGHPLVPILDRVQDSRLLWPRRIFEWTTWRRDPWLRAFAVLALLHILGVCGLGLHWLLEPPRQTPHLDNKPRDPTPGPTRYEGGAKPYHLTLGPEWKLLSAPVGWDRAFQRGESVHLMVRVFKEQQDLTNAAQEHAERIKTSDLAETGKVSDVTVLDDRRVLLNGRDWADYKLEVAVEPRRYRVRCYSGAEGSFLVLATLGRDDPALDEELTRVFDSFELP